MKTPNKTVWGLGSLLVILLTVSSCKKDSVQLNNNNNTNPQGFDLATAMKNSVWTINRPRYQTAADTSSLTDVHTDTFVLPGDQNTENPMVRIAEGFGQCNNMSFAPALQRVTVFPSNNSIPGLGYSYQVGTSAITFYNGDASSANQVVVFQAITKYSTNTSVEVIGTFKDSSGNPIAVPVKSQKDGSIINVYGLACTLTVK